MGQFYERKGTYPVSAVLEHVVPSDTPKRSEERIWVCDGDRIDMSSQRYQLFKEKGIRCVVCGIEGAFFAKERDRGQASRNGSYHFNLYALDKDGEEVLMTKDHVKAKMFGGKDELQNYQTMCRPCNQMKGNVDKMYREVVKAIPFMKDKGLTSVEVMEYTNKRTKQCKSTTLLSNDHVGENSSTRGE